MTWPRTTADRIARQAVRDLLSETDPGAFGPHFQHPGSMQQSAEARPLAAANGARLLAFACHRLVVEQSLAARGAGETWEDVAQALMLRNGNEPDAAAAYLAALGVRQEDPWWSPARGVAWTCVTCEEVVRDFGPEAGGPDDRESGHAVNCSRHAGEVVAWEALWA